MVTARSSDFVASANAGVRDGDQFAATRGGRWVATSRWCESEGGTARGDSGSGGVVSGIAASPGSTTGTARVIVDRSYGAEPLRPDEILVARTTDPGWLSIFMDAGAMVVDIGGAMSHAAIVVRELGVPCVINTIDGTTRIPDGARITVDGDAGRVTVH